MAKKISKTPKEKGPGFHYSKENDFYIDEMMQEDYDHPFFPKYVYDLACLSCAFALHKDFEPLEFKPKGKTHKINAEQLANSDVDFLLKLIAYYYTRDYRVLDNVNLYRSLCEKFSNAGMTALYGYLKDEEFPNTALIRFIKKDIEDVE